MEIPRHWRIKDWRLGMQVNLDPNGEGIFHSSGAPNGVLEHVQQMMTTEVMSDFTGTPEVEVEGPVTPRTRELAVQIFQSIPRLALPLLRWVAGIE